MQQVDKAAIDDEEIVHRLMLALVDEGARILQEGIAQCASDLLAADGSALCQA